MSGHSNNEEERHESTRQGVRPLPARPARWRWRSRPAARAVRAREAVAAPAVGRSNPQSPGFGQTLTDGKRGGVLTVYDHEDFQHLDPGQAYFSLDYEVIYATQRPLYQFKPNSTTDVMPDLASGPADRYQWRQDGDRPHSPGRALQPAGQPRGHLR